MVKRVADVGFEEDYARYVEYKDRIREEILAKAEAEIAEKTEKLDKLIYDSYIAKPVNEMVKRVLGGNKPSGIYKITRSTGEVYIGKSTDVAAR